MAAIRSPEARGSDPALGTKRRGRALVLGGGAALLAVAAGAVWFAMAQSGVDGGIGAHEPAPPAAVERGVVSPPPVMLPSAAPSAGASSDVEAPVAPAPTPSATVEPPVVRPAPRETGMGSDAAAPVRARGGAMREGAPAGGMRSFRELDF
jgi:hypothetical protein